MKTTYIVYLAAALGLTACANLQQQAKVSKQDAEAIARKQVPDGTFKEEELEKEKGQLVWSMEMSRPGTKDTTEINIDAVTGAIVSTEVEKAGKD